ncbi:hypothetical protein VNO78_10506 [Psophocarpus tetragonolobus]|uniref:Uncharacterized protein n=1 Tax=Psophocarpus tetragonolobus TaxID=3891 RepID=A0AAN9XMT6_PSOTE
MVLLVNKYSRLMVVALPHAFYSNVRCGLYDSLCKCNMSCLRLATCVLEIVIAYFFISVVVAAAFLEAFDFIRMVLDVSLALKSCILGYVIWLFSSKLAMPQSVIHLSFAWSVCPESWLPFGHVALVVPLSIGQFVSGTWVLLFVTGYH